MAVITHKCTCKLLFTMSVYDGDIFTCPRCHKKFRYFYDAKEDRYDFEVIGENND